MLILDKSVSTSECNTMVTRSQIFVGIGGVAICLVIIQGYLLYKAPNLHPIQDVRQRSSAYNMIQQFVNHCDESKVHCILVDQWILKSLVEETWEEARNNFSPCRHFCRNHIYTFAIRELDFQSLKSSVLPKLKKYGYQIQVTSDERVKRSDIPTHINLRFHDNHAIHLVILHARNGWWWYGSDTEDKAKLDFTQKEGALDEFEYDFKVTLDGIDVYMPHYPLKFIKMYNDSYFMPCNTATARQFYQKHPKDVSENATFYREAAAKVVRLIKSRLDDYNVLFWLTNGTLLGWFRQCEHIPYNDVEIGVAIEDHTKDLFEKLKASSLAIEHKFGRVKDSLQYAYDMGRFRLVISFFYKDVIPGKVWTAETDRTTGEKFKYLYDEFTLCWTEMIGTKVRVPCQTETYIKASYGENWFTPIENWDWRKTPRNVIPNGKWKKDELDDVLQLWNKKGKRLTPSLTKSEL